MKFPIQVALTSALIFGAACSPDSEIPTSSPTAEDVGNMTAFGPPSLSPEEFQRFLMKAQRGDIAAMHTLSVHHLSRSERAEAYEWLRRAARLEDCEAIVLLVEDDFDGVTPDEMPHWRTEQKRLGCDPKKNYGIGPTINRDSGTQPDRRPPDNEPMSNSRE